MPIRLQKQHCGYISNFLGFQALEGQVILPEISNILNYWGCLRSFDSRHETRIHEDQLIPGVKEVLENRKFCREKKG